MIDLTLDELGKGPGLPDAQEAAEPAAAGQKAAEQPAAESPVEAAADGAARPSPERPRTPGARELDVPRYCLLVAYEGTNYRGFQLQAPGFDTVAGRLEGALARICPEGAERRVTLEGASRTDAGVHAMGQVCAFSSRMTVPLDRLPLAINSHLPKDIAVLAAQRVRPDFDPRREALSKTYVYRIWGSRIASPFWRDRALHVTQRLDLEACRSALEPLLGRHDFAAFRDTGSSAKTTTRVITQAEITSESLPPDWPLRGEFVTLRISGNGFLYHMVRIIAGTILEIGAGRLPPLVTRQALASGRRVALGPTAPAHGLCLERIVYGESSPRPGERARSPGSDQEEGSACSSPEERPEGLEK